MPTHITIQRSPHTTLWCPQPAPFIPRGSTTTGPVDVYHFLRNPYRLTFELCFHVEIVDTTISDLPEFQIPVNFDAVDVDEGFTLAVLAVDSLTHKIIKHGDDIVLLNQIWGEPWVVTSQRFFQRASIPGNTVAWLVAAVFSPSPQESGGIQCRKLFY